MGDDLNQLYERELNLKLLCPKAMNGLIQFLGVIFLVDNSSSDALVAISNSQIGSLSILQSSNEI
ncbi:hypothetical protein pb186bvf_019366 [Paramecium bursaria]